MAKLLATLPQVDGGPHMVCTLDLTDPVAIERVFGEVGEALGGLDLVVANAGIGYRARVEDLEPKELRRLFATNVEGVLLGARAALPFLRRGTRPVMVLVSSVVGRRGMPTMAAYSASKAAVCSIGEALRLEWAPLGIRVCTLNPGVTRTEIFERQSNPARLHDPELDQADAPDLVAEEIRKLDQNPAPERFLRWKWRWLGALSIVAPKIADRLLASREWMPPPPAGAAKVKG